MVFIYLQSRGAQNLILGHFHHSKKKPAAIMPSLPIPPPGPQQPLVYFLPL